MPKITKKYNINKNYMNEINTIKTELNSIPTKTSQLTNDSNYTTDTYVDSEINTLKKNTRIFKPNFGCTFYLGQANDLQGNYYYKNLEQAKTMIDPVLDYIDEVPFTFHISYNETTSKYYIVEKVTEMRKIAEWIISKGKKVPAIKMYKQKFTIENAVTTYGTIESFHTEWKKLLREIGNGMNGLGIEYFAIHNEVTSVCGNIEHLPYLLEEVQIAKDLGYKVAYDYAGAVNYAATLPEFQEKLDAHFINTYPGVTTFGKKITYEQIYNSFKNDPYWDVIGRIKNEYPDADIIINECGVQDNWYALISPEKFNWTNVEKSNGKAPALYMKALLETCKDMDVKSVWWWYDINYKTVKDVLNKYVRGEY